MSIRVPLVKDKEPEWGFVKGFEKIWEKSCKVTNVLTWSDLQDRQEWKQTYLHTIEASWTLYWISKKNKNSVPMRFGCAGSITLLSILALTMMILMAFYCYPVLYAVGWADRFSGWHSCRVLPRDSGKPWSSRLLEVGDCLPRSFLHLFARHRPICSNDRQLCHPRRHCPRSASWLRAVAVCRLRSR